MKEDASFDEGEDVSCWKAVVFGGSFSKEKADLFFSGRLGASGSRAVRDGQGSPSKNDSLRASQLNQHLKVQHRPLFEATSQAVQACRPSFFFIVHEDPSPRILSPALLPV